MSDDITTRLRSARTPNCYSCAEYGYDDECDCYSFRKLLDDAADKIEHLTDLKEEVQTLTEIGQMLYHDLTCSESFCRLCGEGLREWEAYKSPIVNETLIDRLAALNHADAADAIDEIERLRSSGDALAESLIDARRRHPCDCADHYDGHSGAVAIADWEEARRG